MAFDPCGRNRSWTLRAALDRPPARVHPRAPDMPDAHEHTARGDLALGRALLYRFGSELFRHPGRGSQAPWATWSDGVRTALDACAEDGTTSELGGSFEQWLSADSRPEKLARDHARLIGPTPRAAAMPYETEWCGAAGDLLQFHQLGDISAFYRAFGLDLDAQCGERADHLSVELAFLHFLCVREADLAELGMVELAELCRDTEQKFLSEHVTRWTPAFCARLGACDPKGFYGRAARFLDLWLGDECRRFGVTSSEVRHSPSETSLSLEDCCVSCGQVAACTVRISAPAPRHG